MVLAIEDKVVPREYSIIPLAHVPGAIVMDPT